MTGTIKTVAPIPPEVAVLAQTCAELAQQNTLERFELAVKSRLAQGITNDNELRLADEMLSAVVRGGDAVDAASKPMVSAAHAVHKALLAEAGKWKKRWDDMAGGLKSAILKYRRDKEELARRQQAEIERAVEAERRRKEAEARAAMREGNVVAAQAAMTEAQTIVAPVIITGKPVLDNSSERSVWRVEITDQMAVVKAIAAGVIPIEAIKKIEFNLSFLKEQAARRGGLDWPGVLARQDITLAVRR